MDKALQTMINNMPEKTGKSLEEWKEVLSKKTFSKHSEAMNFLKLEHGITHGFANMIIQLLKENNIRHDDLVSEQYKGKEDLLPIYEKLKRQINSFGNDVEFAPKKVYVSVRRKKQFAIIQPSTKTRLDLGLNFKDKQAGGKLELSGSFNAMCSHRVRIENEKDMTDDVIAWLKEAYELAQ